MDKSLSLHREFHTFLVKRLELTFWIFLVFNGNLLFPFVSPISMITEDLEIAGRNGSAGAFQPMKHIKVS